MKKVIHSKTEAVLILTTFADFDHFSLVNHYKQTCCHGNNVDYCSLLTISNDAIYNYTKSQKVSSAYCKLFQHSKEITRSAPPQPESG